VLEPNRDEAVVFEDYFTAGLRMPPNLALVEIIMKFKIQRHQLTPNVVVQLSKFLWAVASCGGKPTMEVFVKHYELHYQQKKIKIGDEVLSTQLGCITFHLNHYGDRAKLTATIKKQVVCRLEMKVWFYCNVPVHQSSVGGKAFTFCPQLPRG
jgi:hypothetical protein